MIKIQRNLTFSKEFMNTFALLMQCPICFKTQYNLKKIQNFLNTSGTETREGYKKILSKYVDKDEKGENIIVDAKWKFKTEADEKAFVEECDKYMQEEVSLEWYKLIPEEFSEIKLNTFQWGALEPFFEEFYDGSNVVPICPTAKV